MTPSELQALFSPIYGKHGWQTKLAEASGYTAGTINNYMMKHRKISRPTGMYFRLLAEALILKKPIDTEQ